MSKYSIRLSEKHGVNPSLIVCFWCGQDKGIAMVGRMKGDKEAPRRVLLDYEPCDECEEHMKAGITLIGVTQEPQERPQIAEGIWPTGGWCVMKPEALDYIFDEEGAESARKAGKALIPQELLVQILGQEPTTNEEVTQ